MKSRPGAVRTSAGAVEPLATDAVQLTGGLLADWQRRNPAQILELGSRDEVFDRPQDEYTKTLLAAVPRINPEWDRKRRLRETERMRSR